MRILIAIFVGFLTGTSYSHDNGNAKRDNIVPDSLFAVAEQILVNHVGRSFYLDHFVLAKTNSTPRFQAIIWHIELPEDQKIHFEMRFDQHGVPIGGISLPPCAENPLACEVVVDRSSAVALAEGALSANFVLRCPPDAKLIFERSPWNSFAWFVDGELESHDGSERYGAVKINAADGQIVHVYKTENRKYTPVD